MDKLLSLVRETLFEPDIEAFRIMCAVAASHYLKPRGNPPLWLMLIGPSGCGKTTFLECLNRLPNLHKVSELTPKTFLSGWKNPDPAKSDSLLHQVGPHGIVTFKDFTSILSQRHENKSEILAQLRQIHDGSYSRPTGRGPLSWSGRLTVIAASTNAVDADRMTHAVMGERFMELRLKPFDRKALARSIIAQPRAANLAKIQHAAASLLSLNDKAPPSLPEAYQDYLVELATFVSCARTPVTRNHGHSITSIGQPEAPTRIAQSLVSLLLASAALEGSFDLRFASRMALNSIPPERLMVLQALRDNQPLSDLHNLSEWACRVAQEDLEALNLTPSDLPS